MWRILTLFVSLLGMTVDAQTTPPGTYTLLMPKSMRPESPFEVSITYYFTPENANTALDIQMFLICEDGNVTVKLTKDDTISSGACVAPAAKCPVHKIVSFLLPATLDKNEYKVEVNGSMAGQQVFSNSTTIKVSRKVCSVFIQTDRAMYKPSQIVKWRALFVDEALKPENNAVNVSMQDANDNRIKQWLNKIPSDGVLTGDLQLSDQPPLGDWTIQVSTMGCAAKKSFEVAEYVLPKYEVSIDLPSFFVWSQKDMIATVVAKYTYGQPVRGNCSMYVQVKKYSYDSSKYPHLLIKQDLKEGKAVFTVTEAQLVDIVPEPRYRYSSWTPQNALNYREVEFSATCTEELTGKKFVENGTVPVKANKFKLEILSTSADTFKPGLNYTLFTRVTLADGSPPSPSDLKFANGTFVNVTVRDTTYDYLYRRYEPGPPGSSSSPSVPPSNATLTVGPDGMAIFVLQIPKESNNVNFKVTFNNSRYEASGYKSISPFKSRDDLAVIVQLMGATGKVKAGEDAVFKIVTSEPTDLVFLHLISKGEIVKSYTITPTDLVTEFTVDLDATSAQALSPNARAVVLVKSALGEFISDSIDFSVDGAFANNVTMKFSTDETKPGKNVSLTVNAFPGSYVGMLAIDQSALLLATGNDISRDEVIEELKSYDSARDPYYPGIGGPIMFDGRRKKRRSMPCFWGGCWGGSVGGKDTMDLINNAGMKFLTDFVVYVEPPRQYELAYSYMAPDIAYDGYAGMADIAYDGFAEMEFPMDVRTSLVNAPTSTLLTQPTSTADIRVRSEFPETWLWTDIYTGSDGRAVIETKVPDTITSWVASAFAMHQTQGLGLTEDTSKITVFKPFFVSLDLPYSVIRGEELALKVIVFNYLSTDLDVLVTLEKSNDFGAKETPNDIEYFHATVQLTLKVPAGDGASADIWIKPAKLGQMSILAKAQSVVAADAVQRKLLVEPEGVAKDYVENILVDLTVPGSTFEQDIFLSLPTGAMGLVPGSVRIDATAVGDLMGPSIEGLGSLVRMPSGCGEQNMLKFAPNIFVMNYLKASGQQDKELEEKIIKFTESGYQRELTYMHDDGSFSAFGNSDKSGSTWLTAFVVKSFFQAMNFVTIDETKIQKAVGWLLRQQDREGYFNEPGRVIHTDMQGGSASTVTMTAYVATALISVMDIMPEVEKAGVELAIKNALNYVYGRQLADSDMQKDAYTLSILSYALLMGNHENADLVFTKLQSLAINEDGKTHWSKQSYQVPNEGNKKEVDGGMIFVPPRRQAKASDIESTAYAMLSYVLKNKISDGVPILKWLNDQRNSYGGYSSTQDTVMALDALSNFAAVLTVDGGVDMSVAIQNQRTDEVYLFPERITATNALLVQKIELTSAAEDYVRVRAEGKGLALIQIAVQFNIDKAEPTPGINIDITSEVVRDGRVDAKICAWWTPEVAHQSGMVLIEFTSLSGYMPSNLDELKQMVDGLRRVEEKDKMTIFYLDELVSSKTCFTVETERVNRVANLQKAKAEVKPYYEPDMRRVAFYLPSVLAGELANCEKCPECCPSTGPILKLLDKQKFSEMEIEIIYRGQTTKKPIVDFVRSGAVSLVTMVTTVMLSLFMAVLLG